MNKPKLTILCITCNQIKFIRQTLESFLAQKTDFPFEVLIHDDASTDGTVEVIREFEAKYPEIIRPILQTENQFSKIGLDFLPKIIFPRIQTQYVALCEGDDYWTDPLKLQKQVDFLEANPDCTLCFHPVDVLYENQPERKEIFPTEELRKGKTEFTIEDLVLRNFIQTNSVVYRWVIPEKESCGTFPSGIIPGDFFMHMMHAKHGKIRFINEVMGVYRRHDNGIWQGEHVLKYGSKEYRFLNCADQLLDYRFHDVFEKQKQELLFEIFTKSVYYGQYDELIAVGKFPKEQILLCIHNSFVPYGKWTWKHKLINFIAKKLGLKSVYFKSQWLRNQ